MKQPEVKFFRVEYQHGRTEYIAASSQQAVEDLIEQSNPPVGPPMYKTDSLTEVEEDEAKWADLYPAFSKDKGLCGDGTFILGTTNVKVD
ncbi:MAG: hypothetical protein KJ709_05500 [Nanoarchaeota archaeon]|nr:hypothetical protein [Nanoarchaeota archaeon]